MTMRKICCMTFFFVSVILSSCSVQKVIQVDKTEEDGKRTISSKRYNLYRGWSTSIGYNLDCIILAEGDTSFFLGLIIQEDTRLRIDEGRKLLIKFEDGTLMELMNFTRIGPGDYTYSVSSSSVSYYMRPFYSITQEQIKQLMTKRASKIRIEHDIDVIDRNITAEKMSNGISEAYTIIMKALKTPKTIYSDF